MNPKGYATLFVCILMLIPVLMAGCAPVISQEALEEVDQGIRFEQLLENPEAHEGRTMLLGGDIIKTQNLPEKTLIIVLQRPLGFREKPDTEGESKGRFIVSVQGFLDPAIYRPGRKITVVGTVEGKEVLPLGETEYSYPVISRRELYLWASEEYSATQPRVYFGIGIRKEF